MTPDGVIADAEVVVEAGRIVEVRPAESPVAAGTLCPGFVDLQVNGIDHIDVATAEGPDWDRLDERLLAQGTTAWCPTLVTSPLDAYPPALERIAEASKRDATGRPAVLGAHLEGPFLGGAPGAHRVEHIVPVDLGFIELLGQLGVRVVTLAPENPGALKAIRRLVDQSIVVSLGHSIATYADAMEAVLAGASLVTHLFNGMPPLHHRSPGLAGAALADDRLVPTLIADLVHVDAVALRVAARAKGTGRYALVTDAVAWRGERARRRGIKFVDGAPRLANGTIAGSALRMDVAIANLVTQVGVDLVDAVRAASTTPADVVGELDRGRIAPGARADLVLLDNRLEVASVWIGGEVAFGR